MEVVERLRLYGGRWIHDVGVAAGSEFPRVYRNQITGTAADGTTISMTEVVEWTGSRWHMAPLPTST